jgi:hypothetical protein
VCQTCPDAQRALRVLGVFVSSTFHDMQAERDELIKHVALTLPAACERRGVSFGFGDLRWGITGEGSNRGEALPMCLAEIEALPAVLHRSARGSLSVGAGRHPLWLSKSHSQRLIHVTERLRLAKGLRPLKSPRASDGRVELEDSSRARGFEESGARSQ